MLDSFELLFSIRAIRFNSSYSILSEPLGVFELLVSFEFSNRIENPSLDSVRINSRIIRIFKYTPLVYCHLACARAVGP